MLLLYSILLIFSDIYNTAQLFKSLKPFKKV